MEVEVSNHAGGLSKKLKSYRRAYLPRGFNHLPPAMSEMTMKAIAAQVKALLSVERPMAKNAMPRMRNALEILRLFCFMSPSI